ncbi:MAG: NnrS family protein [Gammaproteobacteria bacterium]|nr:NnrS family protein [Gammaproteobacteria bacterium]
MDILKPSAPKPATGPAPPRWVPFALGFRPFFLLAALSALLLIALWPFVWQGVLTLPAHYDPINWHAHEMLFGYSVAVIAGFLLTAVRNWTGEATWTGQRLALLAAVWLLGRIMPWFPGIPLWLLITVDAAFLPLLAVSLVRPLWRGQNRSNRVFVPLLLLMGLAGLLSQLQMLGVVEGLGDMRRVMLQLILATIMLVGGRVMPFFTQNVLPGFTATQRPWVERITVASLALLVFSQTIGVVPDVWLGLFWLVFAGAQAIRLAGWFSPRVVGIPVLWVLHAGYAWLVLGSLLTALTLFGVFPAASALHALTVGAIGVFTLGMMSRVAHGHSGRPIDVSRPVAAAFVIMNLAAVIRVFGSTWPGDSYRLWIDLSAGLWVLCFALFAWHYVPILLRPRIDGRPG